MNTSANAGKDVFVSYASGDRDRVVPIADALESAGVSVWRDQTGILGGDCYGPAIVGAIKSARALLLMCSDASLRSKNVNQEIRLAWKYDVPYLPLLLDSVSYPEQVEYWLEGNQWIEILDRPAPAWLPQIARALQRVGVGSRAEGAVDDRHPGAISPIRLARGIDGLRLAARYTDLIWPVPASSVRRGIRRGATRGLGAPQPAVRHGFGLGSRVRLVIDCRREGHLLLLDVGPEGTIYCLAPSQFSPDARLGVGQMVLPQPASPYDSFLVTGRPGREELLAIVTDEPLGIDWMSIDSEAPARVLKEEDIDTLANALKRLDADRWVALATYFDVTAA